MAWGRKHTAAQTPAWSQDDYHTAFASKIKEQIEQGVAPWQKPWKPGEERLPKNIQTDKPYRGGNSVYLSVTQTAKGYSDNRWATYKQIKDMGGQVRKGEARWHSADSTSAGRQGTARCSPRPGPARSASGGCRGKNRPSLPGGHRGRGNDIEPPPLGRVGQASPPGTPHHISSGIQDVAVTALRLASRVTTGDRLTLVDDGDIEAESSRRTR